MTQGGTAFFRAFLMNKQDNSREDKLCGFKETESEQLIHLVEATAVKK